MSAGLDYRRGWDARDLEIYARDSGLESRVVAILDAVSPLGVRNALEVGSGPGFVIRAVRDRLGIPAVATDVSSAFDEALAGLCTIADASSLPFRDASFDVVIASEVLEHLDVRALEGVAREMTRVSSRFVVVTVPYKEPLALELVRCGECFSQFNSSGHLRSVSDQMVTAAFGRVPVRTIPIGADRTPPPGSAFVLSVLRWGINPSWEPGQFTCPLCKKTNSLDTPDKSLRVRLFLRAKAVLHRLGARRPGKMLYVFEK